MEDVREEEKNSCKKCEDVIGFVEIKTRPYKLFLDMKERDVVQ